MYLLPNKLREYYSRFEHSCEDLKESYERLNNMLNEYRIVFVIPKEKDTFNKKSSEEIFNYNNKQIKVEIQALEKEYIMEYGYSEVYKDETEYIKLLKSKISLI